MTARPRPGDDAVGAQGRPGLAALRVMHVQPMSMDLYGHRDEEVGRSVTYSVSNLASAQARLGLQPTVHLLSSTGRHSVHVADGVRYEFHRHLEPPGGTIQRRFARQFSAGLLAAVAREPADVIHFHGIRQLHAMFAAVALSARAARRPLVGQDRGNREVGRVEEVLQVVGLRLTRAFLAASADTERGLRARGIAPQRTWIVPNGYAPEIFHPGDRPAAPVRPDPLRLLFVSRLHEDKDPLTFAEAAASAARAGRRLQVTVISSGPLAGAVRRTLAAAPLEFSMIDRLTQASLAEQYRSHDLLVHTSLREGWTQVLVEAMASGLPVLCTDIPGPRDVLAGAGVLVPVARPDIVAREILRLGDAPGELDRLRAAGLARVEGFTWDAVARLVSTVYETLV